MTAPVRRGPGRPRKNPLPDPPPVSTETDADGRAGPPPSDSSDPRIGTECHPLATQVGFEDGSIYEAEDGYLTKRVEGF